MTHARRARWHCRQSLTREPPPGCGSSGSPWHSMDLATDSERNSAHEHEYRVARPITPGERRMDTLTPQTLTMLAIVAAVVLIALVTYLIHRSRQSHRLRARFGPEYD